MTTQLFTDSATNNFDAERAVVGAMFGLLGDEPEAMTTMRTLEPQHFLSRDLGAVYGAISGRLKAGESVDFLIIADDLDRAYGPCPMPCGWVGYCVDLSSEATPNLFHAPEYAKMVREAFLRREVTEAGAQLVKLAHNPGGDVRPAMLFARRLLESFDGDLYDQETGDVGEALAEIGSERQTGYPIGVPALDAWLGGIVKGRMLAISGPPGVGKTWLTALLANAALDAGARVAFFSLEMSRADMILRLAVNRHGASLYRLNRPRSQWSEEDRDWYARVAGDYSRLPLKVYSDQRDVDVICGLAKQHEADVVFLDYFQVLKKPADAKSEFEGPEILANRLHNLCTKGELRPAVIVGSQLTQDKIKFDAGAGSHGAFGLKFAAALGERSAGILKISSIEDTGGGPWHLHLKLEKNRFGFDHQSGASGKFVMDRATGLLRQVDGLMPARKPAAAAQPPTRARVEVPGW